MALNQNVVLKLVQYKQILMQKQLKDQMEKIVFGDYEVKKKLPYRIVQAPFRKFTKYQRDGHWNQKQRLKYTVFLEFFKDLLTDPERKKNARIYEMMSDMIITRNPNQCRSHHQKMEKYRTNISDIIASVSQKYEPRVYKQIEEKYITLIKTLLQNSDKYVRLPNQSQGRKVKSKKENANERQEKEIPVQIIQATEVRLLEFIQQEDQAKEAKKNNIKTADSYQEELEPRKDGKDDQQVPMLQMSALKEEFNQHQLQNQGIYNQIALNNDLMIENMKSTEKEPIFAEAASASYLNLPFNLAVNETSRLYYERQLQQLQFQKQWHSHNAQHLLLQWKTELESIKLCEEKIKFYKLTLSQNKN